MTRKIRWVGAALFVLFIVTILGGSAGNSSSFLKDIFSNQESQNEDISMVNVEIVKPQKGHLYVFDREIAPIGFTLVIGSITIQVETSEDVEGIDIYIDDELRFSDYTVPYARLWNEKTVGRHVITAVAHGGNESDEVQVFMMNLPKRRPRVVINEIMADAEGDDTGQEWIELYNAGESTRMRGWTVSNADGTAIATLPNWIFPNNTYLVIHFGEGADDDDFSDGNGTFYTGISQDVFDNDMDECALYDGSPGSQTIVDFIAYCYDGEYEPGTAHGYATKAGIWSDSEYFNPLEKPLPLSSKLPMIEEGNSIGRDAYSNDSNMPQDWDLTGGSDAFLASMGRCNIDIFGIVDMEMPLKLSAASAQKTKKWTIMVYMGADNNLEGYELLQLNKLENVGTDNNISIVFQIDALRKLSEVAVTFYNDTTKDLVGVVRSKLGVAGSTYRGFLMRDNHTGWVEWNATAHRTRIYANSLLYAYNPRGETCNIGERNSGEAGSLTEFINWAKRVAPAERYMLILSSHGQGWKGLIPDVTSNVDLVYMHELKTALDSCDIDRFDIIGFDMCLMAMIEVGYQIYPKADMMVASQEVERALGWDYRDIFTYLQDNSDASPEDFASYIVDSYDNKNSDDPCRTLSAIRLESAFKALVDSFYDFGENLKEGIEDWGDTEDQPFTVNGDKMDNCNEDIWSCLYQAEFYADKNFIDLYDFIENVGKHDGIYSGYKEGYDIIMELINQTIIHEKHGPSHPDSHGLSIYFPQHQTEFHDHWDPCNRCERTEFPFDFPINLSRIIDPASPFAIYAEDYTIQWGKVPYIGGTPHPHPETLNLLFRRDTQWDEFLHRYYKPCADAGEDQEIELPLEQDSITVFFHGHGSSSVDDSLHTRYFWDFDDSVDNPAGNQMIPLDDMDADGVDETNDDNQAEGQLAWHSFGPGTYVVTLTVWDDHYYMDNKSTNSTPNTHYKTDQDTCVIVVTQKPPSDTEPPETTIIEPPDGTEFEEDNIMVSGLATDNVGIVEFGYHFEWDGGEADDAWEVDNLVSYEFAFTLALHPGWNDITVYARDAAGNEGSDNVTVYYYPPEEDTTPPVTTEEVGQPSWENGYVVTPGTPIWLNATDDLSGVNYIHYEIWWDSDGDGVIETKMGEDTAYASSVEFCFGDFEIYS